MRGEGRVGIFMQVYERSERGDSIKRSTCTEKQEGARGKQTTAPFACKAGSGFGCGASLESFSAVTSCSASTHLASSRSFMRASSSFAPCNARSDTSGCTRPRPPLIFFVVVVVDAAGAARDVVEAVAPPGWYSRLSPFTPPAGCGDVASLSSRSLRRADPHCSVGVRGYENL